MKEEVDLLTQYYMNQGGNGVGNIYQGIQYQRGYGIGNTIL